MFCETDPFVDEDDVGSAVTAKELSCDSGSGGAAADHLVEQIPGRRVPDELVGERAGDHTADVTPGGLVLLQELLLVLERKPLLLLELRLPQRKS